MAYTKNVRGLKTALRLILVVCFLFCLPNFVDSSPLNSKKVAEGIDYLTRFGYLVTDDPRTGNLRSQQDLEKSIKMLQRYGGLPETGKLDAATINLMGESRCGVSDFGKTDNTRRKKRYTLQGSRWKKRDLTYKIKSFTSDIRDIEKQRQTFRKAFKLWSDATNLRINEDRYADDKNVDIHISFESGYHSDAYPFDGQGGTLAHAFYPHNNLGKFFVPSFYVPLDQRLGRNEDSRYEIGLSGDAHFDDGERFTIGAKDGINLDWVAVHEFGHSLGLEHSNVRESIMYPWYKGYKENIELTNDDKQGIQALYGGPARPTNPAAPTPKPTTTKPPIPEENDVCSMSSYDTFFLGPDKKTYALKGTQYWIISSGSGAGLESGPHRVTDLWKELPNKIDAAYTKSAYRLVFFSGAKVWQYYYSSNTYYIDFNGPRDFRQLGLPMDLKDMDAAFVWGRNSRTYFFKGDKYWRYNGRKIDYGYPKSISAWKGLPANIDGAMKWRNGKSYFFAGSTYYRFDDWEIQVEADYPKSIALKWMRCEKDNLGVITTTTPDVTQNTTRGYHGCDHVYEQSSGSAVYPSLVTLFSLLLAILKLNF